MSMVSFSEKKFATLNVKSSFGDGTWYDKGTIVRIENYTQDGVYAYCTIMSDKKEVKIVSSFLTIIEK